MENKKMIRILQRFLSRCLFTMSLVIFCAGNAAALDLSPPAQTADGQPTLSLSNASDNSATGNAPLPGATYVDDGTHSNRHAPAYTKVTSISSKAFALNQTDNTYAASPSSPSTEPTLSAPQDNTALPTPPISSDPDNAVEPTKPTAVENQVNAANAFGNTTLGRTAFTQLIRTLMPLDPQQIITLRHMFDQSQKAVATYPGVPPKPTSSSILVNMSPGAAPPVIRLRAGYVSSLVFLDSTGQPWPVTAYDLGNPKSFNIQPTLPDGKSNTLIVQAMDRYQEGNLAVMLKDENTPVMLTLIPGQRAVDYRVDLRIPGLGPNATVAFSGLPQAADPILMSFLDGAAPQGSTLLSVEGAPAQAWLFQNHLILRTRVTILSPGWIASMSSPDGTHVYELAKTPVILASQRGEMLQLSIKGM